MNVRRRQSGSVRLKINTIRGSQAVGVRVGPARRQSADKDIRSRFITRWQVCKVVYGAEQQNAAMSLINGNNIKYSYKGFGAVCVLCRVLGF